MHCIFCLCYLTACLFMWLKRDYVPAPLGDFTRDIVILCIFFTGFVCLVQFLRTSGFQKSRFRRACICSGIRNSAQEYPILRRVYRSGQRLHEKVYEVENNGVTVDEFWTHAGGLNTALNIRIGKIEEHKTQSKITKIYFTPRKYVKPMVIHPDNKAFVEKLCGFPNLLCVGKTGSGKSTALLELALALAEAIQNLTVVIGDYKKSSFAQFEDTPNFYGYQDVITAIKVVYQEFSERLMVNDEKRNSKIILLLIDEYSALISSQERKLAEELKTMIGNMLFMGRSLGIRVFIGVQRADSEYFKAGARDQFRAILALGDLSKEQKQMLFSEYKDKLNESCDIGEGYLYVDGQGVERVYVAQLKDSQYFTSHIREAMSRPVNGCEWSAGRRPKPTTRQPPKAAGY